MTETSTGSGTGKGKETKSNTLSGGRVYRVLALMKTNMEGRKDHVR